MNSGNFRFGYELDTGSSFCLFRIMYEAEFFGVIYLFSVVSSDIAMNARYMRMVLNPSTY